MNMLDFIGNTPLFNIDNIYIKLEMFNPSGSIKDRVAKEMIKPYIGDVHKNFTVVEATSGNTGISVAMVCSALGLKSVIVCPDDTSFMKIKLMQQYGADVILTEGSISDCIDHAKLLSRENSDYIYPNQFENQYNIIAQKKMALEAKYPHPMKHFRNKYDAIVAGAGTGGTLMGLHRIFPDADVYEVQPLGNDKIEGICDGVKTLIPDSVTRDIIHIPFNVAQASADGLSRKYGISCGYSSGANYYASHVIRNKYERILTVFADNGIRYL